MTRPALTPGEGGGKPAKPESEGSQSWLPSYIYAYVNPAPPVPMPPVPDPVVEGDDDRQDADVGNDRTDDEVTQPDPGQGESHDQSGGSDDTSEEIWSLDIYELRDDFGSDYGLADSISPEGLYACGNVDILLVKQDMETRPLTFSRCFEQFPSPRIACDFLYAEVPNCSDSELANLQQQIAVGGPDTPAGMADGGHGRCT